MSESSPFESTSENEVGQEVSLKEIIQAFLQHNRFLHEFRLQKLIYIADLVSKMKNGDSNRLTNADFRPYMYGSYSEKVRRTLDELKEENELPHKRDRQYGKITTVYLGSGHHSVSQNEMEVQLQNDGEEIVEAVSEAVRDWSSEDLGDWSKSSWLYQNTPYEEEMNFDRLDQVRTEVREDLIETFPSLESVL